MPDEQYWLSVLSGDRRGVAADLVRAGLSGLENLYAAGLSVYLAAETIGIRRRSRLPVPVISIGNLSVGGTGKTPMTQWLARRLMLAGVRPGILNRGHGGAIAPQAALVSSGDGVILLSASDAGDEAALLAQTLEGVSVAVGKDRHVSGRLLIKSARPSVILLDDGLQYWQLFRDLDIVLLDSRKPFENGHALPRGLLREPKRGLGRAGAVVFTRADQVSEAERVDLRAMANRLAPRAPIFFATHRPGRTIPLNAAARDFTPKAPLLVCGIAQPQSFAHAAREAGLEPVGLLAFADHQPYGDVQKEVIAGNIRDTGADSVIVTAKDAVKMSSGYIDLPVFALEVSISIDDPEALWAVICNRCGIARAPAATDDEVS